MKVLALLALLLAACAPIRPHAAVRYNSGNVQVTPSLHTSFAGIGVSVSP